MSSWVPENWSSKISCCFVYPAGAARAPLGAVVPLVGVPLAGVLLLAVPLLPPDAACGSPWLPQDVRTRTRHDTPRASVSTRTPRSRRIPDLAFNTPRVCTPAEPARLQL